MRRAWVLLGFFGLATAGACVIGPKQDDPLAGAPQDDGGFSADTSDKAAEDTAAPTSSPDGGTGAFTDASADAKTDAPSDGDASGDAPSCAEGSVPLTASGPWNDAGKCWESGSVFFECVGGIDGGAALTCFAKISTGELFLAATTHIPSGSDYRVCTDAERTKTSASTVSTCK